MNSKFGVWFRSVRRDLGLTQVQVEEKASLGFNTVSQWERGRVERPSLDTLERVIQALHLDRDTVLNRAGYRAQTSQYIRLEPIVEEAQSCARCDIGTRNRCQYLSSRGLPVLCEGITEGDLVQADVLGRLDELYSRYKEE